MVRPNNLPMTWSVTSSGLPVRAHRDSVAYRIVKFMRRHAVAVVISGVFALALIAGIVGTGERVDPGASRA